MKTLERIRDIMIVVRKAFEHSYPYSPTLMGFCGRASIQLFYECRREWIDLELVEGSYHAFCMYRGYILDITATQFNNYPPIYIAEYPAIPPRWFRKLNICKDACEIDWVPDDLVLADSINVAKFKIIYNRKLLTEGKKK